MHVVLMFHVQEKQNLAVKQKGAGGEGEDQGGVTVPGEVSPGSMTAV